VPVTEVGPPGFAVQAENSNHRKLRRVKSRGGERCGEMPAVSGVTVRNKWFWLKFREAGRVVLVRPSGCVFSARRGRASGVLVPGTVTVYPAYRTNRVSILDAIDQPSASRNLSQNHLPCKSHPRAETMWCNIPRTPTEGFGR